MGRVRVIIGGDVYPGGGNLELFKRGDASAIFGPLFPEFQAAQCVVINLECPLYDGNSPIAKNGPALNAPTQTINGIKNAHVRAVNLSNNHALDHGEAGLRSTMEVCAASSIVTFGAGPNLHAARRIEIITVNNVRIGFLGLAEHEFSCATESSWGANPLDLIDYVRNIRANRHQFDHLIVLLHGGTENYPLPSPRLMATCRFLVEEGAKVVICQHSHCAGCYEEYLGGYIVYGQGNLVFPGPKGDDAWHQGFVVNLEIQSDGSISFSLIPFQQSRNACGIGRSSAFDEKRFMSVINTRSIDIQNSDYVKAMWSRFCSERRHYLLSAILGHGRLLSKINSRYGIFTRLWYSRKTLLKVRNFLMCESHREAIESVLEMESQR